MLTGPQLLPTSGHIKKIVFILHGYGASGDNIIDIAHSWKPFLPDTLFIAPNAIEKSDIVETGYQWFGLPDFNPFNIRQGLDKASPILLSYIKELMLRHSVLAKDVALVGFSQGTIMALETLFQSLKFAGIVGYSGAFYPPPASTLHTQTPVLLIHGTSDTVVPYGAMLQAQMLLNTLGVPVKIHTCQGLEHSINKEGLQTGLFFLQEVFSMPHNKGDF